MNKKFRTVRFRDENSTAWTVDIEIRSIDYERTNRETLEKFHETKEISFSGEGGNGCGQIDGHIVPRTEGQRKLLEMWDRFHLCGMGSGTVKQSEYLKTQYAEDYSKFIETFSEYDLSFRSNWSETAKSILHNLFPYNVQDMPWVEQIIEKDMNGNPLMYILGDGQKHFLQRYPREKSDFYTQCFFLAIHGLYSDRGYKYGHGWLYEPVPDNIEALINEMCDLIEAEEAELTETLNPVFDMGAEDFKATPSIVEKVMELRDCDEAEAKRFIALGMTLECTFGDLDDTFEEVDEARNLYRANGTDYYIGTDKELYTVASDYMEDGCYDDLWREAVHASNTEKGLSEWCQEVLDVDGWCNILNGWDGRYDEHKVGDEWICVSRT